MITVVIILLLVILFKKINIKYTPCSDTFKRPMKKLCRSNIKPREKFTLKPNSDSIPCGYGKR
jgi:hypothetical protein